jgi:hypothetical protein
MCPPDETTFDYVRQRTDAEFEPVYADDGASYIEEYRFDVRKLEPLVAAPHSPDNRKTARECRDVKIDRVYIGCGLPPSPTHCPCHCRRRCHCHNYFSHDYSDSIMFPNMAAVVQSLWPLSSECVSRADVLFPPNACGLLRVEVVPSWR